MGFERVLDALALLDLERAQKAFDRLPVPNDVTEDPLAHIERHLLAALLSDAGNCSDGAQMHFHEAMALGETHSLVDVFVNVGPEILDLLSGLPGEHQEFRESIITRHGELYSSSLVGALADPLTNRELEILSLLPSRLTNIELAHQFYVSVNTIKTHMAHIFQKLGAVNRNDAIAQARAIGLL